MKNQEKIKALLERLCSEYGSEVFCAPGYTYYDDLLKGLSEIASEETTPSFDEKEKTPDISAEGFEPKPVATVASYTEENFSPDGRRWQRCDSVETTPNAAEEKGPAVQASPETRFGHPCGTCGNTLQFKDADGWWHCGECDVNPPIRKPSTLTTQATPTTREAQLIPPSPPTPMDRVLETSLIEAHHFTDVVAKSAEYNWQKAETNRDREEFGKLRSWARSARMNVRTAMDHLGLARGASNLRTETEREPGSEKEVDTTTLAHLVVRQKKQIEEMGLDLMYAAAKITELEAENSKLEHEIRYLRAYGNKDCTAMADFARETDMRADSNESGSAKTNEIKGDK